MIHIAKGHQISRGILPFGGMIDQMVELKELFSVVRMTIGSRPPAESASELITLENFTPDRIGNLPIMRRCLAVFNEDI